MRNAPLLTSQVARQCHVSAETVREWNRSGKLHATKTASGVRLYDPRVVAEFQRARQVADVADDALVEAVAE